MLPVLRSDETEKALAWVTGTCDSLAEVKWEAMEDNTASVNAWYQRLEGPAIVYLHGSPLHDIRAIARDLSGDEDSPFEHCLSLTEESDFTDLFRMSAVVPTALIRAVELRLKGALYCFLGHSLADPYSRLKVFQHAHMPKSGWEKEEPWEPSKFLCFVDVEDGHLEKVIESLNVRPHFANPKELIDSFTNVSNG